MFNNPARISGPILHHLLCLNVTVKEPKPHAQSC